jgi:hypothetical protein
MYDVKDIVNSYIPYMLAFALREVYIFDTMYYNYLCTCAVNVEGSYEINP